jgi:hypothetical protein
MAAVENGRAVPLMKKRKQRRGGIRDLIQCSDPH